MQQQNPQLPMVAPAETMPSHFDASCEQTYAKGKRVTYSLIHKCLWYPIILLIFICTLGVSLFTVSMATCVNPLTFSEGTCKVLVNSGKASVSKGNYFVDLQISVSIPSNIKDATGKPIARESFTESFRVCERSASASAAESCALQRYPVDLEFGCVFQYIDHKPIREQTADKPPGTGPDIKCFLMFDGILIGVLLLCCIIFFLVFMLVFLIRNGCSVRSLKLYMRGLVCPYKLKSRQVAFTSIYVNDSSSADPQSVAAQQNFGMHFIPSNFQKVVEDFLTTQPNGDDEAVKIEDGSSAAYGYTGVIDNSETVIWSSSTPIKFQTRVAKFLKIFGIGMATFMVLLLGLLMIIFRIYLIMSGQIFCSVFFVALLFKYINNTIEAEPLYVMTNRRLMTLSAANGICTIFSVEYKDMKQVSFYPHNVQSDAFVATHCKQHGMINFAPTLFVGHAANQPSHDASSMGNNNTNHAYQQQSNHATGAESVTTMVAPAAVQVQFSSIIFGYFKHSSKNGTHYFPVAFRYIPHNGEHIFALTKTYIQYWQSGGAAPTPTGEPMAPMEHEVTIDLQQGNSY